MKPLNLIPVTMLLSSCVAEMPVHNWINHRYKRELVDLHQGEFCVDVSTFGEIKYNPVPREKCDSTFAKRCEDKTENLCDEVTEIECEVVPYTECEMVMEMAPYRSFKMVTKQYRRQVCKEGMKTLQHTKMMPECKNVTKQNCITKWETDENGKQVWAGNEACEPVTWRECKLVPRLVDFKVPKIECSEGENVPYQDCEDDTKETMTTSMRCDVKHVVACQPKISKKCKDITYQECVEEPEETCETIDIKVPFQEKEHKKKCLLPDDGSYAQPAPKPNLVAQESRQSYVAPATTPPPSYAAPQRGGRQQQQFRSQQHAQRQSRTFRGRASPPTFVSTSQRAQNFNNKNVNQRNFEGAFIQRKS